jgi:hypothetical protein
LQNLIEYLKLKIFKKKTTDNGKYFEIIIDRFEVVSEDTSIIEMQLKVRKINKIRKLVGYIDVHQPVGNELNVAVKTLKKQGKTLGVNQH